MRSLKRYIKLALTLIKPGVCPKETIKEVHPGCTVQGDLLVLFAHFDHKGRVADYVLAYLSELRRLNCDVIFISTSPFLTEETLTRLKPLCAKIIRRENRGLDFASWKAGLSTAAGVRKYQGLLFLNDSVLGPLRPLDDIFTTIRSESNAVLGLTESHEVSHHIQSYFIYVPMRIFCSITFQVFWRRIVVLNDKDLIIHRYEVGLSSFMRRKEIPFRAIVPIDKVRQLAADEAEKFQFRGELVVGKPLNPTLHMWDILLEKLNYPFIKREILTRNRIGSDKVDDFKKALQRSRDDIAIKILSYLKDDPV